MPMRPELQADRPIYDYNKNKVYYIRSVTHNYTAGGPNSGGTYTTSVSCNAGRLLGQKIASNVFALSKDKATKNFQEFIKEYTPFYNIKDLRLYKYQSDEATKKKQSE